MAGSVAIVPALNNWKHQYPNPLGLGSIGKPNQLMHCIVFGLSIFTVQLLVVAYHIFYEINVAHKELHVTRQVWVFEKHCFDIRKSTPAFISTSDIKACMSTYVLLRARRAILLYKSMAIEPFCFSADSIVCGNFGWYSRKVTKLETANFSHLFYGTPRVNTFITFEWYKSEIHVKWWK